jgi:hypothetical protein
MKSTRRVLQGIWITAEAGVATLLLSACKFKEAGALVSLVKGIGNLVLFVQKKNQKQQNGANQKAAYKKKANKKTSTSSQKITNHGRREREGSTSDAPQPHPPPSPPSPSTAVHSPPLSPLFLGILNSYNAKYITLQFR